MDQPSLIVDDLSHPGVRILTLNRIAKANALHEELYALLTHAFGEVNDLPLVRAVVLKSSSSKIFCAGADVHAFAALPLKEAQIKRRQQLVNTMCSMLTCHKPVIAALQGKVIGAGAMLALAADAIVATPSVTLSFPEIHLAMPSPIGIAILKKRAGLHHIHRLIQLGEILGSEELTNALVIDRLCDTEALMEECLQYASAPLDQEAYRVNKNWLNRSIMAEILDAQGHLNQLA